MDACARVRGIVGNMLRSRPQDVEDVLQDACLRAWDRRRSFRGEARYTTWFTRIAINAALMHLRRRWVRDPDEPVANADVFKIRGPSPEDLAIQGQRYDELYRAVEGLPQKLRQGAERVLRECSPQTNAEKSVRFRLRRKLREILLTGGSP